MFSLATIQKMNNQAVKAREQQRRKLNVLVIGDAPRVIYDSLLRDVQKEARRSVPEKS